MCIFVKEISFFSSICHGMVIVHCYDHNFESYVYCMYSMVKCYVYGFQYDKIFVKSAIFGNKFCRFIYFCKTQVFIINLM